MVPLALQDHLELKDNQEALVCQDHWEHQEHQDSKEHPVLLEPMDSQDPRVPLVVPGMRGHKAKMETEGLLELVGLQEDQEPWDL